MFINSLARFSFNHALLVHRSDVEFSRGNNFIPILLFFDFRQNPTMRYLKKTWMLLLVSCFSSFGTSYGREENWHTDSLSPIINHEPKMNSASDFYLKEMLNQLIAINKKMDRAMIRVMGSTVKGTDNMNDEHIRRILYSNFTQPNCESLMYSESPSGIYHFPYRYPKRDVEWLWNIFEIYCDQSNGGGWTVIQKRDDKSSHRVNFTDKSWGDYANGFGDVKGEFWLGNEWIHRLTNFFGPYELRLEFEDQLGNQKWAEYAKFEIHSHKDNYRIRITPSIAKNLTRSTRSDIFDHFSVLGEECSTDFDQTWWSPDKCIGVNLNSDNYRNTKMMIRLKNNWP